MRAVRLEFQPMVVRRTLAHELFFMSISSYEAAKQTPYPALEGRLMGESFELMVKAMAAVITGPQGKLPKGHAIARYLDQGADYEREAKRKIHQMIRDLWKEWEQIERIIDEDIDPPQARYGAAGSRPGGVKGAHATRAPISGSRHPQRGWWISQVDSVYRELKDSVGSMIWSNWPDSGSTSADGLPRRISIKPAMAPGAKIKPCYPTLNTWVCCLLLTATRENMEVGTWGVIPFNREPQGNEVNEVWVRTRIDMETAVDAQVRYDAGGASEVTSNFRWVGKPQEGIRLQIHEGHSVVREAAPGLWLPQ